MAYDNRPQLIELSRAGFACRAEHLDRAKSVLGLGYVLGRGPAAAPVPLTGTTVDTSLASVVIPGGLLGPMGLLRITAMYSTTGSAANKRIGMILGGNDLAAGVTLSTAGAFATMKQRMLQNTGEGRQAFWNSWGEFGNNVGAPGLGAVDTTVDQTLDFRAMLSSGADSITLEFWTVEVFPS